MTIFFSFTCVHTQGKRHLGDDVNKRSHSLDGDLITTSNATLQKGSKGKSTWSKVKGIVKSNRGSLKSRARTSQMSIEGSRDASPCGSLDITGFDVSHFRRFLDDKIIVNCAMSFDFRLVLSEMIHFHQVKHHRVLVIQRQHSF